jgi:hypothetical protein
LPAVDLPGVEHREPLEDTEGLVLAILLAHDLFVEHDRHGGLATPDLALRRAPLAIGAPDGACVTGKLAGHAQSDDVDALISRAAGDVDRQLACAASMPGHGRIAGIRLDGGHQRSGDLRVDVAGHCSLLIWEERLQLL